MANSNILFITVTVRHTEYANCEPPRFRAHKIDQPDFPYPMNPVSLERFQYLVDIKALLHTQTKLYSNRVILFYSVGYSFMDGEMINLNLIGENHGETDPSRTAGTNQ